MLNSGKLDDHGNDSDSLPKAKIPTFNLVAKYCCAFFGSAAIITGATILCGKMKIPTFIPLAMSALLVGQDLVAEPGEGGIMDSGEVQGLVVTLGSYFDCESANNLASNCYKDGNEYYDSENDTEGSINPGLSPLHLAGVALHLCHEGFI